MQHSLSYTSSSDNERFALAYLERYGDMIHAQDAEDHATISHLRPIFRTVQRLGGAGAPPVPVPVPAGVHHHNHTSLIKDTSFTANADETFLHTSLGGRSGSGSGSSINDSIVSTPPPSSSASSVGTNTSSSAGIPYDDKLTFETMQRFKDDPMILSIADSRDYEVLKTDQQLCLVLKTIVEAIDFDFHHTAQDAGISFAELCMCYKVAVSGMQALQMLPGKDMVSDGDRKRTWGRSLLMLRLFSRMDMHMNMNMHMDQIDDPNRSLVSYDEDDDEEEQEQVLIKKKELSLEAFESRQKDDNLVQINAVTKTQEAQIERLNNEVRGGKRRANILLGMFLLSVGGSAGLGHRLMNTVEHKKNVELLREQLDMHLASTIMPSRPAASDTITIGERELELAATLSEAKEKLNFATTQVGSMVLDMAQAQDRLSSCLELRVVKRERERRCEPCSSSTIVDSPTADSELKQNKKPLRAAAAAVRRQIFTILGTAAVMAMPSFLPVGLLPRLAAMFARFIR